jgi:hypothetical protein
MAEPITIDAAMRALAEAKTPTEFVNLATTAETLRHYAIRAGLGLAAQNKCAELRLRAECALGVILTPIEMRGRPKKGSPEEPFLAARRISKKLSSRAQRLAAIPVEMFDTYIADTIERGEELTTRGLFRHTAAAERHARTYYTNPEFAKRVIAYFAPSGRILDPCRGNGAFYDNLPAGAEWCEITLGRDFLDWSKRVDWIITNPDWSPAAYTAISRHAFEIADNVVFLTILHTALGTYARHRDFRDNGHALKEVILVDWEKAGFHQEGFVLALFHWQRGWKKGTTWRDWCCGQAATSPWLWMMEMREAA